MKISNVIILGANGRIARIVTGMLLDRTDDKLTLYLRRARRLDETDNARETIVEGDVNDSAKLAEAMGGQDIVYANLGGSDLVQQTQSIVNAMHAT